jgi:hypothetical protein
VYVQIERDKLVDLITIEQHRNCKAAGTPALDIIRHMRNATAHARFTIDQSQGFKFWDQQRENTPIYWRASASNPELMAFLNGVGKIVMYLRDARSRPLSLAEPRDLDLCTDRRGCIDPYIEADR